MAHITDEEKRFIKGVFTYYNGKYTGQEILDIVNNRRGNTAEHINIGRISEVKMTILLFLCQKMKLMYG